MGASASTTAMRSVDSRSVDVARFQSPILFLETANRIPPQLLTLIDSGLLKDDRSNLKDLAICIDGTTKTGMELRDYLKSRGLQNFEVTAALLAMQKQNRSPQNDNLVHYSWAEVTGFAKSETAQAVLCDGAKVIERKIKAKDRDPLSVLFTKISSHDPLPTVNPHHSVGGAVLNLADKALDLAAPIISGNPLHLLAELGYLTRDAVGAFMKETKLLHGAGD
jgi:hypothetical protein